MIWYKKDLRKPIALHSLFNLYLYNTIIINENIYSKEPEIRITIMSVS